MSGRLAQKILEGDEKSAARLISLIEEGEQEGYRELSLLYPHTGKAHVIGVTGPPGAGKSTITGKLAVVLAKEGKKVGVVAIDPTSMQGKGALLGDRLRMKDAESEGIFIRSMANRGYSGGMARATAGAACVLEALGKDTVIVESLGAGQAEKDVFYLCDTTIIVFTPDYGDEIQLLKAGLMEIGDIVIVNKGDLPGTAEAQRELSICASTRIGTDGWTPPVLVTRADKGEGLTQAAKAINDHWSFLGRERRQQKRKEKTRTFVEDLVKEEMWTRFSSAVRGDKECIRITEDAINRKIDPYSATRQIIEKTLLTIKTPTED